MTTATLLWALVLFASLSTCDRQDDLHDEPVEQQWSSGCGGWNPLGDIKIAVGAAQLDSRDPTAFLLSVKFINEGGRGVSLRDPRILPPYADPGSITDPSFKGTYPPILLRVGQVGASGEAPTEWTVLLPSPIAPDTPREITLDSGANIDIPFTWRAPGPGRYTLQAISGEFGRMDHIEVDPRCLRDDIDPLCFSQTLTEQHFEVPAR